MKTSRNLSKVFSVAAVALTALLLVGGYFAVVNNAVLLTPAAALAGYGYEIEADYDSVYYPDEWPEDEYQPEPEPESEPEPEPEVYESEPPQEQPQDDEYTEQVDYIPAIEAHVGYGYIVERNPFPMVYNPLALPVGDTFTIAEVLALNGFSRSGIEYVQFIVTHGRDWSSQGMIADPSRIQAAWDLFVGTRLTTRGAVPAPDDAVENISLMFIYSDSVTGLTNRGSVYIFGGNPWSGPFVFADARAEQAFIDLYYDLFHGFHGP